MKSLTHNNYGKKYLVEDCPSIRIDKVVNDSKKLVLRSLVVGFAEIDGVKVRIRTSKLHHGGNRLWFECPMCKQKKGVIYRHPVDSNIGCRKCLNLDYKSHKCKGMIETEV